MTCTLAAPAVQVKLVKCVVHDVVVDVSFDTVGGLCTVAFLEAADRRIGRQHLFKRSILLVRVLGDACWRPAIALQRSGPSADAVRHLMGSRHMLCGAFGQLRSSTPASPCICSSRPGATTRAGCWGRTMASSPPMPWRCWCFTFSICTTPSFIPPWM